ncbi:MAG: pyridoxal-dependent decarboxylase [Actinomycetota bacterium]
MHRYTGEIDALSREIDASIRERISQPQPLDHPRSLEELTAAAGTTITPGGLGGDEALRIWNEVLAPACVSTDHPANLAFVPAAPTKSSILFDLVVGASSIIASAWIDASGVIYAENQALRWISDLVGLPTEAGGVFVSGGSAANLSAMVTGRHTMQTRREAAGRERPARWKVAASDAVHSSVITACRVMDAEVLAVSVDDRGRMTGPALEAALDAAGAGVDDLFGVVATGGTTNAGIVDDLEGIAEVCSRRGLWFHVDAAYGGAALVSDRTRSLFAGIEHADSVTIDPHKWLFAPFDCAALVYRDPSLARVALAQEASYLDTVTEDREWSPMHYAYHLTRRARGMPFWFSLAVHGTDAYREAVDRVLDITAATAEEIRWRDELELVLSPELSVVLFRRHGWEGSDYDAWSAKLLRDQIGYVLPTTWRGEKVVRMCFVNPETTLDDIRPILDTLRG